MALRKDEALIFVADNGILIHVFAVAKDYYQAYTVTGFAGTRDQATNDEARSNTKQLVMKFREALNLEGTDVPYFDVSFANEVYERLFGQLDAHVRVRRNWLIVPSGSLTALPFHLLVTERPRKLAEQNSERYRQADWLVRSHTITILPSVESIEALRVVAGRSTAKNPLSDLETPHSEARTLLPSKCGETEPLPRPIQTFGRDKPWIDVGFNVSLRASRCQKAEMN